MFYATEIALREQLKYPPFCDIIVISFNGSNEADIKNKSDLVYRYLKDKLENKFKISNKLDRHPRKLSNR